MHRRDARNLDIEGRTESRERKKWNKSLEAFAKRSQKKGKLDLGLYGSAGWEGGSEAPARTQ